ncbi:MAG TPA: hypothetical protein VHF22_07440 [Planctomycetota bacterium]|nr:hypothetical protein [Planctomycetota bacterium]
MTHTRPGGKSGAKITGEARPRRKLPNTRLGNLLYLGKLLLGFFLMPFWPIFVSIGARDAYYVNHYFETLWHCLRTMRNAIRNGSWGRIFKYNLADTRQIEEQLGARMGACTRCAKCCKMLQCDYLAYDRKTHEYFCSVYDTPYWILGACGRYPIDQTDIDDYNCPGFAFPESVEKARFATPAALVQIGKLK